MVRKSLLFLGFSLAVMAPANDGFYQGAGNDLRPVANPSLRVVREELTISPLKTPRCFPVVIPKSALNEKGWAREGGHAELGKEVPCPPQGFSTLQTRWHAKAVYEVEVLKEQKDVQMGFPVPSWYYATTAQGGDRGNDLSVPAVVNFKTWIGETPVAQLTTQTVPVDSPPETPPKKTAPAYVWTASFKKGDKPTLTAEYDFGVDYSTGFSPGSTYPEGSFLWFDTQTAAQARFDNREIPPVEVIFYYLHPLKLWASPPPESIHIRVEAPNLLPVYYLIPNVTGIHCVDRKAIHFLWKNTIPEQDFRVSYPSSRRLARQRKTVLYPRMTQQWQFDAWYDLLGKSSSEHDQKNTRDTKIPLSCDLVEEIKKDLPKDSHLSGWVKNGVLPCLKTCNL